MQRFMDARWVSRPALALFAMLSVLFTTQTTLAADFTAGTPQELSDAINTANGNSEADTITITADITLSTPGGDNSAFFINTPIVIDGQGFTITRDTAQTTPEFRFLVIAGNLPGDTVVELKDLTLANFKVSDDFGGALLVAELGMSDSVELRNVTITNSEAGAAGALNIFRSTVKLYDSTLENNEALGGSFDPDGPGGPEPIFDIIPTGGAIQVGEGTLEVYNSSFSGNRAGRGGAIQTFNSTLLLDDSDFTQNQAFTVDNVDTQGIGGVVAGEGSSITVQNNSSFSQNAATMNGGAFSIKPSDNADSAVTITDATFTQNGASLFGGTVYVASVPDAASTLDIIRTEIVDSGSNFVNGGALHIAAGATVTLTDGSIRDGEVLPIYNAGTLTTTGTTIRNNIMRGLGLPLSITEDAGPGQLTDEQRATLAAAAAANTNALLDAYLSANPTLDRPTVDDTFGEAGAIYMEDGSSTTIDSSRIQANISDFGGAFAQASAASDLTIRNGSVLTANLADISSYGVVRLRDTDTLTVNISDTCIVNNGSPAITTTANAPQINATGVWWGAASGPGGDGPGVGNVVQGNVAFSGFSANPLPECPDLFQFGPYSVSNAGQLVAAVEAANALDGTDTINLIQDITLSERNNLNAGANGLPIVTEALIVNGNGRTLSRAEDAPALRFFTVIDYGGNGVSLTLNNLTLTGGLINATGTNASIRSGGAVYAEDADITINNSSFVNNTARFGGAVSSSSSNLVLDNSTFSGNQTIGTDGDTAGYGGAINATNGTINGGDNRFEGNTATVLGGAIYSDSSGTLTDTYFLNNTAPNGGAINYLTGTLNLTTDDDATCFVGNSATAVLESSGTLNAPGAWWGRGDGPGGAGPGTGDSVNAGVDFSGFLTVEPQGCASTPFNVTNAQELADAIAIANNAPDTLTTINIANDITLTDIPNAAAALDTASNANGPTAFPIVAASISIEGSDYTLRRDASAPDMRFFEVATGGDLFIFDLTLAGGNLSGPDEDGGAIYNAGNLQMDDVTFTGNQATGGSSEADYGRGGAIYSAVDSRLNVFNGTFTGNGAGQCGAVGSAGLTDFSEATFTGNSATDGGAYCGFAGSDVDLEDSEILDNSADDRAGAIWQNGGQIDIIRTTLKRNAAGGGTGGAIVSSGGASTNVNNSIVEDNTLDGFGDGGGALYNDANSSFSISNNSCIANNDDIGVQNDNSTPYDATQVWWGSSDGPGGAGSGAGDSVNANVNFSNFLTDKPAKCSFAGDQRADLTFSTGGFSVAPDHVAQGAADVLFNISNIGSAASGPFSVRFYASDDAVCDPASDRFVGQQAVPSIDAGNGYIQVTPLALDLPLDALYARASSEDPPNQGVGTVSSNQDFICGVIDVEQAVSESDESNNSSSTLGDGVDDITYFPWDVDVDGVIEVSDVQVMLAAIGTDSLDFDGNGLLGPKEVTDALLRLGYERNASVCEGDCVPNVGSTTSSLPTSTQ